MHFSMSHKVLRGEPVSKLSCHEMRASPDLSLFSKSEPSKDINELNGSNYWPTETEERLTKWLQVSLGFYSDGSQAFCEHPLLKEDRHARFKIIICWIESLLKPLVVNPTTYMQCTWQNKQTVYSHQSGDHVRVTWLSLSWQVRFWSLASLCM